MAKRKEFSSLQMVLTLVLVCGGAAMALAFVSELTKKPIEQARLNAKLDAIRAVLPDFTNNPFGEAITIDFQGEKKEIYPAYNDKTLVGVAIPSATASAYGGKMELLFGFDPKGKVLGVAPLLIQETPGLGDGILKDKFLKQFIGEKSSAKKWQVTKDGGNIDAVTAATISSRAATSCAANAFEIYNTTVVQTQLDLIWSGRPESKVMSLQDGIAYIFPDYANQPIDEATSIDNPAFEQILYPARDAQGALIGIGVTGYVEKGYKGPLRFLVGLMPEGTIHRIATLEEKETPGLGASVATPKFLTQFTGQGSDSVNWQIKKKGGDIDAVTGATISSEAAIKAILTAFEGYRQAKEKNLIAGLQ